MVRSLKVYDVGRVYRIVCDCSCDKIYIGSTFQTLSSRMCRHRSDAKHCQSDIYKHMREVGMDNFRIELIQSYNNLSVEELRKYENEEILRHDFNNIYNQKLESPKCPHGRRRTRCSKCGNGAGICSHGRIKFDCVPCDGVNICSHHRVRRKCLDCNDYRCEVCDIKYSTKQILRNHKCKKNEI